MNLGSFHKNKNKVIVRDEKLNSIEGIRPSYLYSLLRAMLIKPETNKNGES